MAARVCRTSRVTGLERTETETGGLAVGRALTVAATALSARETTGRRETSGAATAAVMRFLVMRPVMVFGFVLLFVMVVMVMLGFVRSLVTTENPEKRTGRTDRPDLNRGIDYSLHGHRSRRFARGFFLHHFPRSGGHELSVFWNYLISRACVFRKIILCIQVLLRELLNRINNFPLPLPCVIIVVLVRFVKNESKKKFVFYIVRDRIFKRKKKLIKLLYMYILVYIPGFIIISSAGTGTGTACVNTKTTASKKPPLTNIFCVTDMFFFIVKVSYGNIARLTTVVWKWKLCSLRRASCRFITICSHQNNRIPMLLKDIVGWISW